MKRLFDAPKVAPRVLPPIQQEKVLGHLKRMLGEQHLNVFCSAWYSGRDKVNVGLRRDFEALLNQLDFDAKFEERSDPPAYCFHARRRRKPTQPSS